MADESVRYISRKHFRREILFSKVKLNPIKIRKTEKKNKKERKWSYKTVTNGGCGGWHGRLRNLLCISLSSAGFKYHVSGLLNKSPQLASSLSIPRTDCWYLPTP